MITVAELRGRSELNTADDHELIAIRAEVVTLWETLTGGMWDRVVDDVFDYTPPNTRSRILWLPRAPVSSILTVEERYENESTFTALQSTSFILAVAKKGRVEKFNSSWRPRVRVTYTGGYDETTCPADIRDALFVQARYMRERIQGDKLTVKGSSNRQGVATFLDDSWLHARFKKLAQFYRRSLG